MKVTFVSFLRENGLYGLRILIAKLKSLGYKVTLINLPTYSDPNYSKQVLSKVVDLCTGSDLIGISVFTNTFYNAKQVINALRMNNNNQKIILGGVHPTVRPQECIEYADAICIGEAEDSFPDLVENMKSNDNNMEITGFWFNTEKGIIRNPNRPLTESLDDIPLPDYDFSSQYILDCDEIKPMDQQMINKYHQTYTVLSSRGCPHNCTYCINNFYKKNFSNGAKVRYRSIDNLMEELIYAKQSLPSVKAIDIGDDLFFARSLEELSYFSKLYKEHISLPLAVSGITCATFSKEKIDTLLDAGLFDIRIGVQSGSKRTLKLYKRKQHPDELIRVSNIIKENEYSKKLTIRYDFILDSPWDNDQDHTDSLMLISKLEPPYLLILYSMTFFPGTELAEKAVEAGYVNNNGSSVDEVTPFKYYFRLEDTFFNRLYTLARLYGINEKRIKCSLMRILTNRLCIKSGISYIIYNILTFKAFILNYDDRLKSYKGVSSL